MALDNGVVIVDGLTYSYPGNIRALDEISFNIGPGQKAGLIGPNGAGKSTIFLCLLGLVHDFTGSVEVAGIEVNGDNLTELRRRTGLVFQDPEDQLFNPTIIEDVAFGPLNLGWKQEEAVETAKSSLAKVGFPEGLSDRAPQNLSAGQKRRAAIAGILAMQPEVVLLDEPTSDLDPRGRNRLSDLLKSLPQTMIIASHDLEFVLRTCEVAVLIDDGKVIVQGDPKEVMSDRELMEAHGLEKPHSLMPHNDRHHG